MRRITTEPYTLTITKCPTCSRQTLTGDKCVTCLYASIMAKEMARIGEASTDGWVNRQDGYNDAEKGEQYGSQ